MATLNAFTEVYAMSDPAAGWDSFIRNSLTAHAETYPDIWYGTWTGPDSYNGPKHERAGEADAHVATADIFLNPLLLHCSVVGYGSADPKSPSQAEHRPAGIPSGTRRTVRSAASASSATPMRIRSCS